jgi:predicted HNH restriction endonuclease
LDVYGEDAAGFIQVHHLVPLSRIGRAYRVDPVQDLRPICANCHAVVHLGGITRSIEEVRKMLDSKC